MSATISHVGEAACPGRSPVSIRKQDRRLTCFCLSLAGMYSLRDEAERNRYDKSSVTFEIAAIDALLND